MRRILLGLAVSSGFLVAHVLFVGALTCFNVVLLGYLDAKFADAPWQAWLEVYWPLWSVFYAPAVIAALLAAWYSDLSLRRAAALLGAFLLSILVVMEATWLTFFAWPRAAEFGQQILLAELAILTAAFLGAALACRRAPARRRSIP